jgi:hypothetical protein
MSAVESANLDTSILFNYVYSYIPGDIEENRGSQELIDSERLFCVIGPKAEGEIIAGCGRRYDLYDDLLEWLENNPEESIYSYDPTQRDIHTTSNDLDHIRYDIQHEWSEEPRRKQLSDIRRCQQDLGNFQKILIDELIDRVYGDLGENEDLLEALEGLGLRHDKEIIVDAVEIHRVDDIDVLVAVDSGITEESQRQEINNAIRSVEEESLVLRIRTPNELDT